MSAQDIRPPRRRTSVAGGLALGLLAGAVWLVFSGPTRELPEPDTRVGLQEYSIAMAEQLDAGQVVIELVNNGQAHHNFTLCPANEDGDGCGAPPVFHDMLRRPTEARDPTFYDDRADSIVLGKRWRALLSFDLEPGVYYAYCAIVGHNARGMNATVTVTEASVEG